MELSVLERLVTLGLLPQDGDYTNLRLVRVARESLSFTEEELKLLNFREEGTQTKWDSTVEPKEILIGETVTEIIQKSLKDLNDTKKLKDEHLTVYEKFID